MINTNSLCYRRLVPLHKRSVSFVLLTMAFMATPIHAQQTDIDPIQKSTSLMLQFFGPEALGIHVNHNTTKRIAMNFGLGVGLDAHIGLNGYLTDRSQKRFAWYGGLQVYLIREVVFSAGDIFGSMGSSGSSNKESQIGVYIPLGFEYIATKGFTLQLDIGPNLIGEDWGQTNTAPIMGSFKIGYTFRAK